jgi:hypothetical protein
MKERELTCNVILLQKPKTLDHRRPWSETAYHWAVVLTLTTETTQTSVQVNYKTGNGLIDRPKNSSMQYTDSMERAFAAGLEKPYGNHNRYRPTVPTLTDICYSLRSDYEYGGYTFREFVSDLGYDDAADAHDTWEACKRQRADLERAGITMDDLDRYVPDDY